MTTRTRAALLALALTASVAGCDGGNPSGPAAPPPPPQVPVPPSPPRYFVADVTLSGVVSEMTSTGLIPIPGARVYLSDDQDVTTDANGFFSFKPVWTCPCTIGPRVDAGTTVISVSKDGYGDPPGQPISVFFLDGGGAGWRDVKIDGDTHVEIRLVQR